MPASEQANLASNEIDPSRMAAFSDGVIAVVITIMVLEFHAPEGHDFTALRSLLPVFLTYALSFAIIATYWNNHHHLIRMAKHVTARIMWSNMLLLFTLSLLPFFTNWLGENYKEAFPTAVYGGMQLACALAYTNLQIAIVAHHGKDSELAARLSSNLKGPLSLAGYALAIPLAFVSTWAADALFAAVAMMWFIPDKRLA